MRRVTTAAGRMLVAACFAATFAAMSDASAYCRTTTCDPKREMCPVDPVTECIAVGVPFLWTECPTDNRVSCVASAVYVGWPTSCVGFDIHDAGTPQVPFPAIESAVSAAFSTWNSVTCADGRTLPITTQNLGPVSCGEKTFNQDKNLGNANIVTFVQPWTEDPSALALTTLTFSTVTGTIVDADMEVNDDQRISATLPVNAGSFDLQSIVTHEAGHFLGLSHTQPREHPEAVMYESYESGSDRLRTLTDDDIAGVCSAYGARTLPAGDCQPVHGLASDCAGEVGGGCCAVSPGRVRPTARDPLALLIAAMIALSVRRRGAARHRASTAVGPLHAVRGATRA